MRFVRHHGFGATRFDSVIFTLLIERTQRFFSSLKAFPTSVHLEASLLFRLSFNLLNDNRLHIEGIIRWVLRSRPLPEESFSYTRTSTRCISEQFQFLDVFRSLPEDLNRTIWSTDSAFPLFQWLNWWENYRVYLLFLNFRIFKIRDLVSALGCNFDGL